MDFSLPTDDFSSGRVMTRFASAHFEAAAQSPIDISIVTVTNRIENLLAVTQQVMKQDFPGTLEHIIVVDGKTVSEALIDEVFAQFDSTGEDRKRVATVLLLEDQDERYLYEKLGALRNFGIQTSRGTYIALWDDDNEWEPDHLSSLCNILNNQSELALAHSWRRLMVDADTPFVVAKDQYPWAPQNSPHGTFMYQMLLEAGVITESSNAYRDRHGYPVNGAGAVQGSSVDTGEWLMPRRLFENPDFRFNESYHYLLYHFGATDDPQFAHRLLEAKVPVICSEKFSMRYFMSGETRVYRKGKEKG